jgi:alkanesulfonate monooxygenase SsuD/methylene tetrahydromethanopterin reductase-like flavin-dependent oxidoreductase (luciferase family)
MRFGGHYFPAYVPGPGRSVAGFYHDMLAQFELLETLGFDDVWMTEHHFDDFGGTVPDPAAFLTAAAARTRRIRLGVAIVVMPLHNPVQVAESYAMVDVLSGGRLEFGVGRGSTAAEFESFGVALAEAAGRLKEGTEIVRQAWSQPAVTFHGQHFAYTGVQALPKPVQQPHPPIWVGASRSDDTYRWAGEQGFHLMVLPNSYTPPVLRQAILTHQDALRAAGHDPGAKHVLGKFHVYVAADAATAAREAEPYLIANLQMNDARNPARAGRSGAAYAIATEDEKGTIIAGDPARCIDRLHWWIDTLGLTAVSCTFHFGGMPQEPALKNIRLFGEKVLPAFEHVPAKARP